MVNILFNTTADVDLVDNKGRTALMYASGLIKGYMKYRCGHDLELALVKALLKKDPSTNLQDNNGMIALMYCLTKQPENINIDVFKALVNRPDLDIIDYKNKTGWTYAHERGYDNAFVESILKEKFAGESSSSC